MTYQQRTYRGTGPGSGGAESPVFKGGRFFLTEARMGGFQEDGSRKLPCFSPGSAKKPPQTVNTTLSVLLAVLAVNDRRPGGDRAVTGFFVDSGHDGVSLKMVIVLFS